MNNIILANRMRKIASDLRTLLKPRTYGEDINEDVKDILCDIVDDGASVGWSGSEEELEALENQLKKFNVRYTDDHYGTWELR